MLSYLSREVGCDLSHAYETLKWRRRRRAYRWSWIGRCGDVEVDRKEPGRLQGSPPYAPTSAPPPKVDRQGQPYYITDQPAKPVESSGVARGTLGSTLKLVRMGAILAIALAPCGQ